MVPTVVLAACLVWTRNASAQDHAAPPWSGRRTFAVEVGSGVVTYDLGIIGFCGPTPDGIINWGEVVFDSEGRLIDITRFGVSDQAFLNRRANMRWPCLAGQTIPYFCSVAV